MGKGAEKEMTCTVEFTPGANDRLVAAFYNLYRRIEKGEVKGPSLKEERKKGSA